eukprot:709816-Amphidinium_carterae.1
MSLRCCGSTRRATSRATSSCKSPNAAVECNRSTNETQHSLTFGRKPTVDQILLPESTSES